MMIAGYVVLLLLSQVALYLVALAFGLDHLGKRPLGSDEPFDVVVVLGCRVRPDGTPSATLVRRTELGAHLVKEGRAPRLVLSGGRVGSDTTEASAALPHALAAGIARDAIVLEERSRTTEENAAEVARLLADPDARVLVVTDTYHVLRSVRLFRKHFRHVRGQGVIVSNWARIKGALREASVVVAYLAQGKLDEIRR
jgi:uncharacterized SAM-binding protein YcdF (DUF218 family)